MNPLLKLVVSTMALGGLLYQATSYAAPTNMAEQPLKASVLAKPNVIFGYDDSGSMDFEVMQSTNDGAFWWDHTASTGWSGGALHYNSAGNPNAQWKKYAYLFPNGTGSGARRNGDSSDYHFAIMPTWQLAFFRSAAINPLYYNPMVTYEPWAPAYVGAAVKTYTNAPTNAARSHPEFGTETLDLTVSKALTTTTQRTFMAHAGMWIPKDSRVCSGTSCTTFGAAEPVGRYVPASTVYRVAMAYFPATYYHPEDCGAVQVENDDATCVAAPDGTKLRRYEIKSGNTFPSGRSYADELQNFANWFQYARKRRLMLASAMGDVLEPLTGLRLGLVRFNGLSSVTMYDIDASSAAVNGRKVAGIIYQQDASGGTPTRETLKYIGEQYRSNAGVIQYACQRNNSFILTDGFANASAVAPPAYSQATWGGAPPYQTIYANSLADIALSYYTINLNPAFALHKVPTSTNDLNDNLHMNTYGMTLGAKGVVYQGDGSVPPPGGAWVNPSTYRHPSSVDDLWHATINGRGKMYTASDRTGTLLAIQSGLLDMRNEQGAQSSVAVSTVNLNAGDGQAYLASYNPAGWAGDLSANAVDKDTGDISTTANWQADSLLVARDWTTRVIVTSDGSSGIAFTSGTVGGVVNPDAGSFSNDEVIDYLRGKRDGEGTKFRLRKSLIGAVINAEPAVDPNTATVFLASGEGMLHAFDTVTGKEEWAFVPYAGLTSIGKTVQREYAFKTKLDATPVIGHYTDTTRMLVGGMGAAGRSFYSIDVTSPKGLGEAGAAAKVMWTFPGPAHAAQAPYVGYAVGRPVIINSSSDGYVVLLTSGYDNGEVVGDGKGRMWMLNAATGSLIKTFTTTAGALGAESGLAQLTGFREADGTVRYVYGGDLLGNVWKFDLTAGTTSLLTVLKDPSGTPQPVTTPPQLTKIAGAPVVMIGTGRLLDISDFGGTQVQTIYAIKDTGSTIGDIRAATTALTIGGTGEITGTVDWAASSGWRVDLPVGQMVNTDPKYVLGRLFVNTNVASGASCDQSSYGYIINVMSGYGQVDVLSTEANATHPLIVQSGDKMFRWTRFNDSSVENKDVTVTSTPNPRKNSWRDISR